MIKLTHTPHEWIGRFVRFLALNEYDDKWFYKPDAHAPRQWSNCDAIGDSFGFDVTQWISPRYVLDVSDSGGVFVLAAGALPNASPVALAPSTTIRFAVASGGFSGGPRNAPYDNTYTSGGSVGPESIRVLGDTRTIVEILSEVVR